jgi:uncharacterized protein (DUF2342 family)
MTARGYNAATASYGRAKELAEKAARAVPAGKAVMKADVEQQLANAERRWEEVDESIKTATTKLRAEQRQPAAADAKSVTEAFQAVRLPGLPFRGEGDARYGHCAARQMGGGGEGVAPSDDSPG